jgi:GT2 family glycosyltransferase
MKATSVQEPSIELSIILVSYHSAHPLRTFFESYRRHPIQASHEILVVDNAPGDGVADWIQKEHPEVQLISSPKNVGYARGVNAGIEHAAGSAILVINPDVELSEGGVDRALGYLNAHPEAGIVGARLLNRDGSLQTSARRFYTLQTILLRRTPLGRFQPDHPELRRHLMLDDDLEHPRPVDWVMGAWMLVRRSAIEAVGKMDGRFFMYFEDVDWCYRMWAGGYEVHYFPESSFVHAYERSSGGLNRTLLYHLRSFASYYDKWGALVYVAKQLRRGWEKLSAFALDLVFLNLAFLASYAARLLLEPVLPLPLYAFAEYLPLLAFTNVVAAFTLPLSGRYGAARRERSLSRWIDSGRLALTVTLLVMAGTWLAHTRTFSRLVIVFLFPLLTLALQLSRVLLRRLLAGGTVGSGFARAALVGAPSEVERLRAELSAGESKPLIVAGAVPLSDPEQWPQENLRVLGPVEKLEEIVESYRLGEVLVAGGAKQRELTVAKLRQIATTGCAVYLLPPWAEVLRGMDGVVRRHGCSWLQIRPPAMLAEGAWAKAVLDRLGGALLCLLSLPGFVLCSALGRPLGLVRWRRSQKLGQRRRLIPWPELVGGRSDRALCGLVQLPVFWKVLTGEVSLVGPFALSPPREKELRPIHLLRFAVKPGLSGLWQQGCDETTLESLVSSDLDYLEQWSLTLDLDLLLSALPGILFRRDCWHRLPRSS